MQTVSYIIYTYLFVTIVRSASIGSNTELGKCLRDLSTEEFSNSYNYLQLSSKFGNENAYPGFSGLFMKLSDENLSKGHELVEFLVLRKITYTRLIHPSGIVIHNQMMNALNVEQGLSQARHQNRKTWKTVERCHQEAEAMNEANIQDYLESHLLNYHIDIDKLLSDIENRLQDAEISKKLITYMIDEELLNTFHDFRKDIFT